MNAKVKIAAFFALGTFIILAIFAATLACCIGFRDADVCWTLAIGRAIVDNHGLLFKDPFSSNLYSYVFVGPDLPLIQYQWLAAVFYYETLKWTGQAGLLTATGLIAYASIIALPMTFFDRARVPKLTAFLICILGFGASYLRIMTRAHTLGMILFAILVSVNLHYRFKTRRQQIITLIVSSLMVALWTNVHVFFLLGPVFLGLNCAVNAIENLLKEKKLPPCFTMQFITFVVASLSTLINPWGYKLLLFEYKLTHSSVSFTNLDNQAPPINSPAAWFIFALILTYLIYSIIFLIRKKGFSPSLTPLLYLLFAGAVLFKEAVLIPQVIIIAAAGLSEVCIQENAEPQSSNNFIASVNSFLDGIWKAIPGGGVIPLAALGILGAYTAATSRAAQLPEDAVYFKPPLKAIEFLKDHPQSGRVFNDALFGSCMTWYFNQPIDIFIDGRFSVYEPDLVQEYEDTMLCKKDWQGVLKNRGISYVFAPPRMPLIKTLSKDTAWKQIYSDDRAVILVRK